MIIKIINRRVLLQGFAATHCLAAIGWPQLGLSASEALSTQHITDKILVIAGAGGNVVLYQGREGLTLIDSGCLTAFYQHQNQTKDQMLYKVL